MKQKKKTRPNPGIVPQAPCVEDKNDNHSAMGLLGCIRAWQYISVFSCTSFESAVEESVARSVANQNKVNLVTIIYSWSFNGDFVSPGRAQKKRMPESKYLNYVRTSSAAGSYFGRLTFPPNPLVSLAVFFYISVQLSS